MSSVVDVLKRAKARIEDPKNWTQGALARTHDGVAINSDGALRSFAPDTVCFCAMGAVLVGRERTREAVDALGATPTASTAPPAIGELGMELTGIAAVNDRLGHEAVMNMFDEAIAAEEAKQ